MNAKLNTAKLNTAKSNTAKSNTAKSNTAKSNTAKLNKSQEKHERILHVVEIAKALFIQQGYRATTTARIAQEAKIAELTLFRYFPTKRMLFEAVIQPLVNFEELTWGLMKDGNFEYTDLFSLIHNRIAFVQEQRELVRLVISESQFQPDLTGDFNPINNIEKQFNDLFLSKGLPPDTCQLIIHLIKGLLLSIAFTARSEEATITTLEKLIGAQILHLLQQGRNQATKTSQPKLVNQERA